jgi:hypothetical protein
MEQGHVEDVATIHVAEGQLYPVGMSRGLQRLLISDTYILTDNNICGLHRGQRSRISCLHEVQMQYT